MRPLLLLLVVLSQLTGRAQPTDHSCNLICALQNLPVEMNDNWSYNGLKAGSYEYQEETIHFLSVMYSIRIDTVTYLVDLSLYEKSQKEALEADVDILWNPDTYYAVEETENTSLFLRIHRQGVPDRQDFRKYEAIHDELSRHFQKHYNDY